MTEQALTVRLDTTLFDRLRVAALVCDTTSADLLRTALEHHLTDIERSSAYKRRRADLIIATTPVEAKPPRRGTKAAMTAAPPPDPATEPENR